MRQRQQITSVFAALVLCVYKVTAWVAGRCYLHGKAVLPPAQGGEDERLARPDLQLVQELGGAHMDLPRRKDTVGLGNASHVLSSPLQCYPNAPVEFHTFQVIATQPSCSLSSLMQICAACVRIALQMVAACTCVHMGTRERVHPAAHTRVLA